MEKPASRGSDRTMGAFLEERAQQLFLLTDQERKGFIVKRDMQRMRSEIPLAPEQLESVFDSLDVNNNGYLTIEQFLSGFGEFIASHSSGSWKEHDVTESSQKEVQEDESIQFLLQELESINMLHNVEILKQLCHRVEREANPNIQNNLEAFLQQLVTDLKKCQEEQGNLEEALKLKDDEHEAEVRRLFEEMEVQLHEERTNQTWHEEHRVQVRRKNLEQDLVEKEQQLQDALDRQQELAERVRMLRSKETHVRAENERLLRAKAELEVQLQAEHREVAQLQRFLDDVRQNEAWERHKYLSAGFRLAKRIVLEQQGLMRQLRLLQKMTSTLENGGENKMASDGNCQDLIGDEFNLSSVESSGMKLWKRHLYHLNSEDDFFEGAEFLACQKSKDDGDTYQQTSPALK